MNLKIKQNMSRYPFSQKWQFCIGSCHAATLLRADTLRHLKRVHDELGIRYVRCHGIFNDDMHTLTGFQDVLEIPGGDRFVERSFWHCAVVYDNILDCGMKPFVELSFMPEHLAKNKTHGKILYGSITSMPESTDTWSEYITAFVRYLIHRYGQRLRPALTGNSPTGWEKYWETSARPKMSPCCWGPASTSNAVRCAAGILNTIQRTPVCLHR